MRFLLIFSIIVILSALFFLVMPINGEEAVYSETIRLHVIANSDSDYDQSMKLHVRDRILAKAAALLGDTDDRTEAQAILESNLDGLEAAANAAIKDYGSPLCAAVTLSEEYYPTREYDGIALPKGAYLSMRVSIGDADGRNFWCVLFPGICTGSAAAAEKFAAAGFTPGQIRILTESENPQYVLKFKLLEVLEEIFDKRQRTGD